MTYDDAHILPRLSGFGEGVILSLPAGLAMVLTGSATRKPRPVGGELQKEKRGRLVVIKDMHDEP